TAGFSFGPERMFGAEGSSLFLCARPVQRGLGSDGSPVLARPFFDVVNNREDASLVTYPGVIHGSVDIRATSFLQGAEANFTAVLWKGEKNRLTLLAGFRYLNLDEDLRINEDTVGDAGALQFAGARILVSDRFATDNDFFGG